MSWVTAGLDLITGGAISEIQDKNNEERSRDAYERQVYLRSTAHQASVADMRAAGLNPILSATKGATPAPSVAMASGAPGDWGVVSRSTATAAQADLAQEQTRSQQMQQQLMAAQAMQAASAAAVNDSQVHVQAATRLKLLAEIPQVKADTELKEAVERLTRQQVGLVGAQTEQSTASAAESRQRTQNLGVDYEALVEKLKGMRVEGRLDETTFGEVMRTLSRIPGFGVLSRSPR